MKKGVRTLNTQILIKQILGTHMLCSL